MEHKFLNRYPLGNPHRVWKQDKFILSAFSPACVDYNQNMKNPNAYADARRAVKVCADAGFNMLEMGWATPEVLRAAVPACEELGIDLIYQNLEVVGGMQQRIGAVEKTDIEKDVKEIVEMLRPYKHTIGYYIWDEPYHDKQVKEARKQMDLFQKYDPNALLFCVAIPSYNDSYTWQNGQFPSYLERYLTDIDPVVLSLDYYPVGMEEHDEERQVDESLMWCDLGLMKKLAAEHGMPMWFYYQGQNLHNYPHFVFEMVRLFMNAGVLYGAKGLQHYTAAEAVVTWDGYPDIYFEDQKKIHAEFPEIGNTLMELDCKRVFHDASLLPDCPYTEGLHNTMAESELMAGNLPYRVSASEFEDAYGNKYLMVLNRDYKVEKKVVIDMKATSRIYEVSKKDGVQRVVAGAADKLEVTLGKGDMALFRIQPAAEEAFTVEYVLEKNDI